MTIAQDEDFLRTLADAIPNAFVYPGRLSPYTSGRVTLEQGGVRKWHWTYKDGVVVETNHADMTPLGALSPSMCVSLTDLRLAYETVSMNRAISLLFGGPKPRTSDAWEIWPRLWLGRTPEPGEHIDHDWLVRLAQPLAPGVTCREKVHDECFEDSEEGHHVPFALVTAEHLSEDIAAAWHAGKSIRIGCLAGMNRSALVLGAVLCRLGMTGPEAVEQIRWKRGRYALSNAVFHRWLVETFGPRMAAERAAKEPPSP